MPAYTAWFPFRLPPGQKFDRELTAAIERQVGLLCFALGNKNGAYFLRVSGLADESVANAFLPRIHAAVMWIGLQQNLSPECSPEPQPVKLQSDPIQAGRNLAKSLNLDPAELGPVDSYLDTAFPAVYPDGSRIRFATVGGATVFQSYSSARTLELACEACSFPRADAVLVDPKLRVALELYTGVVREASASARFLTMVMALEAMAPDEPKHPIAQKLIDGWMKVLKEQQSAIDVGTEEWAAYDALERELGFRREASVRQRIRMLVRTCLSEHGDTDADAVSRVAQKVYDQRSTLVHNGYLPAKELAQATAQARTIVRRVLEARFVAVAK